MDGGEIRGISITKGLGARVMTHGEKMTELRETKREIGATIDSLKLNLTTHLQGKDLHLERRKSQ